MVSQSLVYLKKKKKVELLPRIQPKEAGYLVIFLIQFHIAGDSWFRLWCSKLPGESITQMWAEKMVVRRAETPGGPAICLREGGAKGRTRGRGRLPRTGSCSPAPGRVGGTLSLHSSLLSQGSGMAVNDRYCDAKGKTVTLSVMWSYRFLGLNELVCWKLSIWVWEVLAESAGYLGGEVFMVYC